MIKVGSKMHAYFWFYEDDQAKSQVHSAVGRICRSDMGGPRPYQNVWTSFVKSRLKCSNFDKIISTASPVSGRYFGLKESNTVVYAIFKAVLANLSISAICAFDLTRMTEVFQTSSFYRTKTTSLWNEDTVSKYRAGNLLHHFSQFF
ncbi:unnamed protein product [Enterobius vermicularis]|uniref:Sema domain-containing protein n=1 Tax=Enterobius vermicularis TaxID=51028 RepID=A0A0N4UXE5_ENTVE|nr:unnamed protein product [Enterobius vermicularis]